MNARTLCIPGPMHPDLFNEATPIMLPVATPSRTYEVTVTYMVPEEKTVIVAARNETEACAIGLENVKRLADYDAEHFDVGDCEALPFEPTDQQLKYWAAWKEKEKR